MARVVLLSVAFLLLPASSFAEELIELERLPRPEALECEGEERFCYSWSQLQTAIEMDIDLQACERYLATQDNALSACRIYVAESEEALTSLQSRLEELQTLQDDAGRWQFRAHLWRSSFVVAATAAAGLSLTLALTNR